MEDFEDFFDSPGRPSNPGPGVRQYSLSSDEEDYERNSVVSSARSGASIRIEARVPSIASDIRSDSDEETPRHRAFKKPPRPSSSKNRKFKDSSNKNSPRPNSSQSRASNAWSESSSKSGKRTASSIVSAQAGDHYVSNTTGKRMRKGRCHYSDTESESQSDASQGCNSNRHTGRSEKSSHYSRSTRSRSQSDSSRSRSGSSTRRSSSSEWSTGITNVTNSQTHHTLAAGSSASGRRSKTPRTPRIKHNIDRKRHRRRKEDHSHSDDTLSISSLSGSEIDTARPASRSKPERPARMESETDDRDKMDLHRLLSALLESEEDNRRSGKKSNMIIEPDRKSQANKEVNYTFSGDRARLIDMENQRLLKNILSQRNQSGTSSATTSSLNQTQPKRKNMRTAEPPRVTHATLNRMREQQRVERENLALLRRLNQIKPTADLNRTKQLESYNKQMAYHCPQMRTGMNSLGSSGLRSRSEHGMLSTSTMNSTGRRSRPASASQANRPISAKSAGRPNSASYLPSALQRKPRPSSAKNRTKPEWENGW